ncbi:MAG TPA: homocitrate synthase [Mycobacterium sp.]|nr:homocitrate synthase [Mycobacterium sp.]
MTSRKYPGTSTAPQFADLFTTALPRGLREQTVGMTPHDAFHIYGQSGGPLRLGNWQCTDGARSGAGLGPQARNYQATIAFDDHVTTTTATAAGPVAALTAMLHDGGVAVEMLGFHQLHSGEHTATFIYGSNGTRAEWAIGWSADATDSALRAVIACANRLSA